MFCKWCMRDYVAVLVLQRFVMEHILFECDLNVGLREVRCGDVKWIYLTQECVQWPPRASVVVRLMVSSKKVVFS
jgi:hypothetical protein